MRPPIALALLHLLIASFVSAETSPSSEIHLFYGEVLSVDLTGKTFTIKSRGQPLVFHYTKATKISSPRGYVRWEKIRPGQGAAVTMRLGPGGIGIATAVRFHADASYAKVLAEYRARTVDGQIVSGPALANHIAYEPPGQTFSRANETSRRGAAGIFKLGIARDGTVAAVRPLKSLGSKERDERAAVWLRKWRFRPNSVTEVQIPVAMVRVY